VRYSTLVELPPTMLLILYQRDDCHLCDLALDVLAHARAPDFSSVFIDDNADLEARYGDRVPVLREEKSARELQWPFDAGTVRAFIGLEN
jgi:Glutaredoxin-like domain (DUF836)